ncbi:MAG TPA: carboxypeptidase regulatory-like domain-containing protein [Longimicrobiaceae bacterium]|nr:carboxypeptidase regulatory-like domain-containing protein [Longimicrobiaceae bacterium]
MRRSIVAVAALALLAGCEGNNLFPEDPVGTGGGRPGSIGGLVTAAGQGVGGAVVSVQSLAAADTTDAAGRYRIEGLDEGAYRLLLRVPPGFDLAPGDSTTRTASLGRGQTLTVNWQLLQATGGP